jgi:hypothetical protein
MMMSKELIERLRDMQSKKYNFNWAGRVQSQTSEAADTIEQQAAEIERLRAESVRLQYICGSAYQMAGAMDAPERFLDALSDPVSMTQEQIDALLPITGDEIYEAVTRLQSERADYEAAASAAPVVPDGWNQEALKLMDDVDYLMRWACVHAPAHLYKVSSGSFWKVCHMIAAAPKEPTPQTSAHKQSAVAAPSPPNTHG